MPRCRHRRRGCAQLHIIKALHWASMINDIPGRSASAQAARIRLCLKFFRLEDAGTRAAWAVHIPGKQQNIGDRSPQQLTISRAAKEDRRHQWSDRQPGWELGLYGGVDGILTVRAAALNLLRNNWARSFRQVGFEMNIGAGYFHPFLSAHCRAAFTPACYAALTLLRQPGAGQNQRCSWNTHGMGVYSQSPLHADTGASWMVFPATASSGPTPRAHVSVQKTVRKPHARQVGAKGGTVRGEGAVSEPVYPAVT
jgi:hypothetical protein